MAYRYGRTHQHPPEPEIPAPERIINAAIDLYGERGFNGVTLKEIAKQAGVSAPLVVHHFTSKAGLRTACDKEASRRVYAFKAQAIDMGQQFSWESMLAHSSTNRTLLQYLTQAMMVGGEEVDALMDQLVDDAVAYTTEAVEQGLVRPSPDERRRAALLLLHGFGSLILHHQMKRLLGTSPLIDPPEQWGPYMAAVLDVYSNGVFEPGTYQDLVQELPSLDPPPSEGADDE